MIAAPPRIEARGLRKAFDGKPAVAGISFAVPAGEIFALLGPNGSGKTTTVRLVNGVLAPDAGEAFVDGIRACDDPVAIHARAGVMTETAGLYENISGRDNLLFFGAMHGMDPADARARADELLGLLELSEAAPRKAKTYSTGMRKRLSLARALLARPAALFLDEPTSGLDPESARAVTGLIRDLAARQGATVFLCTHQLKYAEEICTLYGFLHEGRMLGFGRFDDLAREMGGSERLLLRAEGMPDALRDRGAGAGSGAERGGNRGMARAQGRDGAYSFDIKDDAEAAGIVAAVVAAGGRVFEARRERMSLEDLYFAYRGRAEAEAAREARADAPRRPAPDPVEAPAPARQIPAASPNGQVPSRTARMRAVVRKDAREILHTWELLLPMTILPLVFAVAIPLVIVHEAAQGLKGVPPAMLAAAAAQGMPAGVEGLVRIALDYLVPPLFLFLPLLSASILAAASFAGEREGRTLESLLYTPIPLSDLFLAKLLSTLVPSLAVTLGAGLLLGVTVDAMAWRSFGLLPFPNARFLFVLLLLSPAVAAFSLGMMTLVSAKARTLKGAQQLSGFLVMPFAALLVAQTSGIVMMGTGALAAFSVALLAAAFLLMRAGAALFTPERLL